MAADIGVFPGSSCPVRPTQGLEGRSFHLPGVRPIIVLSEAAPGFPLGSHLAVTLGSPPAALSFLPGLYYSLAGRLFSCGSVHC